MADEQGDQAVTTSSIVEGETSETEKLKLDKPTTLEDTTSTTVESSEPMISEPDPVSSENPSTTSDDSKTETMVEEKVEVLTDDTSCREAVAVSTIVDIAEVIPEKEALKEEQITTSTTLTNKVDDIAVDVPDKSEKPKLNTDVEDVVMDETPAMNSKEVELEKVETPEETKTEIATEKSEDSKKKTAVNTFYQGKRYLLCKNISQAVTTLGEACKLLSDLSGIFTSDSGEAHFYYGKALLEQARTDLNVFENPGAATCAATKSGDEDEDEEEMEEDEDEDGEAEKEEGLEKTKDEEEMNVDTDETENEKSPDADIEEKLQNGHKNLEEEDLNVPSPKSVAVNTGDVVSDGEKPGGSSEAVDPDATVPEEELTNLELAWEVLEVAKVSYTRLVEVVTEKMTNASSESDKTEQEKELKSCRKKLASVYSMLGEVATESELYPQAIEEIHTSLAILAEIEEVDSREIAQCHFQLGIAYSFDKKFDEAIKSFQKSSDLIQQRLENLKKKLEVKLLENNADNLPIPTEIVVEGVSASGENTKTNEADENTKIDEVGENTKTDEAGENAKTDEAAEIEELKALLPELQEKINDTLDAAKDAVLVIEEEKQEKELIERSSPVKNPNPAAVNDISHLVKKKKKAEDLPDQEPPSKRLCTEPDSSTQCSNGGGHEVSNGASTTTE